MKNKYIDPLTDFGFKKLFGTEPNKALLIDFLNALLPSKHSIKDLEYDNNEQLQATRKDRSAAFDIYCKSAKGEYFIVELQRARQKHFKERSVYYSSFPIRTQAKPREWNFDLKAVYTICILDFKFEAHKEKDIFLHEVKFKNQEGSVFYDKLTYVYIELPKFKKSVADLETKFEKWLYLFRYLPELNEKPKEFGEQVFNHLFNAAEIANFSPMELSNYERSLKILRDNKNTLDFALEEGMKEGLREGIKEGLEKGKLEGRIEGLAEGKLEGKLEGLAEGKLEGKLEMIKTMQADNVPMEKIIAYSGLTREEIETLLKQ